MLVIHCKPLFSCLFHSFVYHLSIFLTSSFSRGKCPVILNHKSSHFRPIVSHFSPIPPPSPSPPLSQSPKHRLSISPRALQQRFLDDATVPRSINKSKSSIFAILVSAFYSITPSSPADRGLSPRSASPPSSARAGRRSRRTRPFCAWRRQYRK